MLFAPVIKSLHIFFVVPNSVHSSHGLHSRRWGPVSFLSHNLCEKNSMQEIEIDVSAGSKYVFNSGGGRHCLENSVDKLSGVTEGLAADGEDKTMRAHQKAVNSMPLDDCKEKELDHGKLQDVSDLPSTKDLMVNALFCASNVPGQSTLTYPDGSVFQGEFKNYMLNGKGKITSSCGLCAEGTFVDNKLHGRGKLLGPDGICVTGNFMNGKLCGWYKTVSANGHINEGYRVDGKSVGPMKTTFAAGDTFEGSYTDGKRHGPWIFRMRDGTVIEGQYHNGVKCGCWTYTLPNGTVFEEQHQ